MLPPPLKNPADPYPLPCLTAAGPLNSAIIQLVAKPNNELPDDLFDILNQLPGFNSAHISFYYAHLVANPHVGRAFYKLPFEHKLNWVTMFIAEKFPGM